VIASHYVVPLPRRIGAASELQRAPSDDSELIRRLDVGEPFDMLDDSLGWVWGYAGEERRVGYVRREAIAAQ
jgi:Bacterial dipeptidyl-peptidase Sh3 domain